MIRWGLCGSPRALLDPPNLRKLEASVEVFLLTLRADPHVTVFYLFLDVFRLPLVIGTPSDFFFFHATSLVVPSVLHQALGETVSECEEDDESHDHDEHLGVGFDDVENEHVTSPRTCPRERRRRPRSCSL